MNEPRRDDEGIREAASKEAASNEGSGQPASDGIGSDLVRTSRLAVAACVLAILSLLLLPGLIRVSSKSMSPGPRVREVYQTITWGTSLCATALGLVSLVRIGLSAERLTGRGLAEIGVAAPVIQYVLFLFVILPAMPRSLAFRMTCGTNLSGIGKAMLIYANDYQDELPRAGGRNCKWAERTRDWKATDRRSAFGLNVDETGGEASISASLYLLVKYSEVTPEMFVCSGTSSKTWEEGVTPFKLGMYRVPGKRAELIDFWDFGPRPWLHCSYSYHVPYGVYALTTSNEPGFAVAADRNPWMDSSSAKAGDFSQFRPEIPPFGGTAEQARKGNTPRHQADGQNVLFLDSHVDFAKRAYCSVEDDNIYTISGNTTAGDPWGTPPKLGSQPANRKDSLLVNDPPVPGNKR